MRTKRLKPNGASCVIDLIHNAGNTDYIKDGVVYKNAPMKTVMVEEYSDTSSLTGYEPGTIAYTAGFTNMWQLSANGTWVAFE